MKKIFAILFVGAAIVACSKDKPAVDKPVSGTPSDLKTITVTIPESLSKVSFSPAAEPGDGVTLSWSEGDKIRVISGERSEVYDIQPGFSGHTASFSGPAVEGNSFTVIYPADFESESAAAAGDPFANQVQNGNGSTDGLKYVAVLSGVDSFEDIQFNEEWATAHGGSFRQNGVVRIREQFPADVKSVDKVFMHVKVGTSSMGWISLDFPGGADISSDHILTAYAALPLGDMAIPAAVSIDLSFATGNYDTYTRTLSFESLNLIAGKVNTFNLDKSKLTLQPFYDGAGTETRPYLIGNARQMQNLPGALVAGSITCFQLVADIDMTGIDWVSPNPASPYNLGIDLDGKNHTISNLSCKANAYPGLIGVLYGSVKDLTIDNATINGSGKAGVLAGYIGTGSLSASVTGVTVKNSKVTANNYAGGLGAQVGSKSTITDCHVINTTVTSTAQRVGGVFGQIDNKGSTVSGCTAENVTLSAPLNVGGVVGVCTNDISNCFASGTITSPNTTSNTDIALGGIVGYMEKCTVSNCGSSVNIPQTTNGRDIGGAVGKLLTGTLKQCYATGNVSGVQRNVGGLIGLFTTDSGSATVTDCYCTGNVTANSYMGGLIGYTEKGTIDISNCYAAGDATATAFDAGGLIGYQASANATVSHCAAWSKTVKATNVGSENWSSGAVVGVCFPTSTMTDNYRNPAMALTANWIPAADYQHANVSPSSPLVKQNGQPSTATSLSKGQDGYPHFPYHGKVEAGKTLSELASTTLGWSSDIWDFSGDRPTLKANPEN